MRFVEEDSGGEFTRFVEDSGGEFTRFVEEGSGGEII